MTGLTRRGFIVSAAGAALSTPRPANAGAIALQGRAFGGTWRAALPEDVDTAAVARLIGSVVGDVDRAMSPYQDHTELTRFNRSRSIDWQVCSPDLSKVAGKALEMANLTDGAFDPTVGPLVNRFGFGPIHGGMGQPADLSAMPGRLRKAHPEMTLDLCGIAKGHALDRIMDGLKKSGLDTALVELGGEIRTLGDHPDGRAWRAAIERPDAAAGVMAYVVEPRGLALATSGNGRQHIDLGASGVSHIIDPASGHPVDAAPASVSVLAESAMEADALATALMVMGINRGFAFADAHGFKALFLRGAGGEEAVMTGNFREHVIA